MEFPQNLDIRAQKKARCIFLDEMLKNIQGQWQPGGQQSPMSKSSMRQESP
jgi:hypothetical protein